MAQWTECGPAGLQMERQLASLLYVQTLHKPEVQTGSPSGGLQEVTDGRISGTPHRDVSLPLFVPPFPSLQKKK